MKKITIILSVLLLYAQSAQTKSYRPKPIETLKSRSAGGAFDETPATKIFEKEDWSIRFFEAEATFPISQVIQFIEIMNDTRKYISDFKDTIKENPFALIPKIEEFLEIEEKLRFNSRLRSRGIVLSILHKFKKSRISYGGYWEGDGQVFINTPNLRTVTPIINYWTAYLDFHNPTDIVLIKFRWDAGAYLEHSRKFRIYKKAKFAIGNRIRFFHRWFNPSYRVYIKRRVKAASDIKVPSWDAKEGFGIALDAFAAFKPYDKIVDSLFSLRMEGLGWVEYNDDTTYYEIPHVAFGAICSPLHFLKIKELMLGIDFENILKDPAFQIGARYIWEKRIRIRDYRLVFGVIPQVGAVIGEKDLFGRKNNSITYGIISSMAIVEFGIFNEYNLTIKTYNFGLSFGLLL